MAVDRLDAIVIGASVEGLVAAAALARAGKAVAVVDRHADGALLGEGRDAVINLNVARELDLTAHGLRFAAAPAVIAVGFERPLVLWPELHAAQASVAAFSARDAEALDGFCARLMRASHRGDETAASWLTSSANEPSDAMSFRLSSVARLLDEAFDNEVLKGLLAQGAIMGTGVAPHAPGSGQLLTRQSLLAPTQGHRFVAGGERKLRQALLALLKFYNNAQVTFGATVREIATEREAVQGVMLDGGTLLRAPLVISTLAYDRSRDMVAGLRRALPAHVGARSSVEPAQLKLTVGVLPKLAGVDAATLTSGAIVRLSPSIARLKAAHGAFRGRWVPADPCVELRVVPRSGEPRQRWDVFVSMPYVPATTIEGPWTGARREKLRGLAVRAIDAVSPSFGASIELAEILHPAEAETLMDARGTSMFSGRPGHDLAAVPEMRAAGAASIIKGATVVEPSIYGGAGEAGLIAAGTGSAAKGRADA